MRDPMLFFTAIAAIAAVAAVVVAILWNRRMAKQQSPALRIETTSVEAHQSVPRSVSVTLTNAGDGLAQQIELSAWVFMVKGQKFKVPDTSLTQPHFTAHITSMRSGEALNVKALRSSRAFEHHAIPAYEPDAVPLIKVSLSYQDRLGKKFDEQSVMAGAPDGHEVVGYDHDPHS
jgi:hypothetical protein